jgi:hypothetical protein
MPSVRDAKRKAADEFLMAPRQLFAAGWSYLRSPNPRRNLVGIGIGPKIRDGVARRSLAVRFYVVHKLNEHLVLARFRLPRKIDGVNTDVIEIGPVVPACTALPGPISGAFRPVQPGCAIQAGLGSGTIGPIVEKDGARFLLTSNHVIANNNSAALGRIVHQPENTALPGSRIGTVTRFIQLAKDGSGLVDAAIAKLDTASSGVARPNVGPLASRTPIRATRGMHVEKVGRTTGHTCGIVEDVDFDYKCPYSFGDVLMENQILIRGNGDFFALGGDSGSLVVDTTSRRATGLLFAITHAEGTFFAVANHMNDVLSALSVRLIV